jgi:hypothetical protein
MKRIFSVVALCVGAVLALNCDLSPSSTTPLAPTAVVAQNSTFASATHGTPIIAVLGTGRGTVNVTPTAAVDGSFSAQITVNVHGVAPDTTLYVQRAPEIGRPNSADGVCQRAEGQPPWGPPTPSFVTFPLPASGPLVTLTTSEGGGGAVHIEFAAPTIADGTMFDVMFRLIDDLASPTIELRSACFTVTVK